MMLDVTALQNRPVNRMHVHKVAATESVKNCDRCHYLRMRSLSDGSTEWKAMGGPGALRAVPSPEVLGVLEGSLWLCFLAARPVDCCDTMCQWGKWEWQRW